MKPVITVKRLQQHSITRSLSRRRGERHSGLHFQPAFLDFGTQTIYPARHADGRLAHYHVVDGLPDKLIVDRTMGGRVVAVKASLIEGYVRNGYFYTRTAAARAVADWGGPVDYPD